MSGRMVVSDRLARLNAFRVAVASRVGRFRRSPAGRVATALLAVVLVGVSAYYLAPHLAAGIRDLTWEMLREGAGWLAASVILITLSIFVGAPVLRSALAAVGQRLGVGRSQAIQTTSNLAGYLPGFGWRYLGKAYLLSREGIPAGPIALAMSIEFAAIILTALVISSLLLPGGVTYPLIGVLTPALRLGALVALLGVVAGAPLLAARAFRGKGAVLRPSGLWRTGALCVGSWTLFGLGFACLVSAVGPLGPEGWRVAVAALAVSFVISLLAVFIPGGLGVREGVMTAMLATAVPPHVAALAAVFSRVVMLVCEVLAFGIVWLCLRVAGRPQEP